MMNKQGRIINKKVVGMIDWTKTICSDGTETPGYTWNPIGGCFHECQWLIDNELVECYAKTVTERVASKVYPNGFKCHYWRPERLNEPLKVTEPRKIFLDSMSDIFGHWVDPDHIKQVLSVCHQANWHTFQSLTKNSTRMLKFNLPDNLWAGASSPPDFMYGKKLSPNQKDILMQKTMIALESLIDQGHLITWISFEPLSWDVSDIVEMYPGALKWAVIGAASGNGKKYQPEREHVIKLLEVLDRQNVPVFFKDNLEWNPRREEFPK